MEERIEALIEAMDKFYGEDGGKDRAHFHSVWLIASTIAEEEGMDRSDRDLLEKAAAKRAEAKKASTSTAGGYTIQGEGDADIDALVLQRAEAKKAKNFAEADRIRDELKAKGIEIIDVPGGAHWKRV